MPILKREPDTYPDSVFEMTDPWWVAHLRSRQEKVLARYLREYQIPFYLPQMEKRVRRGGRGAGWRGMRKRCRLRQWLAGVTPGGPRNLCE